MDIMNWMVVAITGLFCIFNLVYMQKARINKKGTIKEMVRQALPETRKKWIYFLIMVTLCIALAIYLNLNYVEHTEIFIMKRLCLVTLMFPMAAIDYKKYVIPNQLLLVALICRLAFLAVEFITERENLLYTVLSEVITAFGLFIICMIILLVMKGSMGMGDVKLFLIMALFQGYAGSSSAIFMSLIVSFIVSVFLLITKKKGRKDMIPFGPAILVGTFISVFFTGV